MQYKNTTIRKAPPSMKQLMKISSELTLQVRRLDREILKLTDMAVNYDGAVRAIDELVSSRIESHFDLMVGEVKYEDYQNTEETTVLLEEQTWKTLIS